MDRGLELPVTRLDVHPTAQKIRKAQKELNEIKTIVRNNIGLVLVRDGRLDALHARADKMEAEAAQFTLHARRVRRKAWWKGFRTVFTLVALCLFVMVAASVMLIGRNRKQVD